jgi:hypothetical protein
LNRADKIKRAVARKAFQAFDINANVWVRRNPSNALDGLDELEGEIVNTAELSRVIRIKVGDAVPPRYFEVRVKELQ